MNKKKKILFIIWSFGGGAGVILSNIVNNLDPKKYDIDVLRYYKGNSKDPAFKSNINLLNSVIDYNTSMIKRKIYYFFLLFFPFIMRFLFIKKNYDYEIAFNYLIPTFLLSKNKKVKTFAWIHGSMFDLKNNYRDRFFQRRSLKNVNNIFAISNLAKDSIIDIYPEYESKIELIYNGYDFNSYYAKCDLFDPKLPDNNILFINTYNSNKNPLLAIEVAKKLSDSNISFHMTFIGEGELKNIMIDRIKEYKIENRVKILDFKENPFPYIKQSKLIIGTSYSEGFPTIFIESLTMGKPFVTTNVGGALEISDNQKCGFIAKDLDDFVLKTKLLLVDKRTYGKFSKHGLKHVKKYTIDKQINLFEKIINR